MPDDVLKALKRALEELRLPPGVESRDYQPHEIADGRLRLDLSIEEFANKLGVSVQAAKELESGRCKPGFFLSIILTKLFGDGKGGGGRKNKPQDSSPQGGIKLKVLV